MYQDLLNFFIILHTTVDRIISQLKKNDCVGGIGLYGGRGEYSAKIRLYDIGPDGGDQEGDGEMIFETDDVFYECAPKDKYPLMFETPLPITVSSINKEFYIKIKNGNINFSKYFYRLAGGMSFLPR